MHTFRAAQPALLYLSPACIFSVLLLAAIRGELKDFWSYAEESDEPEKAKVDDAAEEPAKKAESGKGEQELEDKVKDVLNGQAGDAMAVKRRTTRSSAKLAEPETL